MTLLCDLAKKYETDKGGYGHMRYGGGDSDTCHNYTPHYDKLLGASREQVQTVLEIGVHMGCSLRMWREYFPNAQILGLDTNGACVMHEGERITVSMADQNNPGQLHAACDRFLFRHGRLTYGFDLIVDDGSHVRDHQIVSLKTLLPYLHRDGTYVIEDLGRGPQDFTSLTEAVPPGFNWVMYKVEGGWGPKVQPYEWLFAARRSHADYTA